MRVEHKILISAPMHSKENAVAPTYATASNTSFPRPALVTDSFTKERQSDLVLDTSNPIICTPAVPADGANKSYEGGVLNELRNKWMIHGHVLLQKAVQCKMHNSDLAFKIANSNLGGSGRLRIMRH